MELQKFYDKLLFYEYKTNEKCASDFGGKVIFKFSYSKLLLL